MPERYTEKDAISCAKRIAAALGVPLHERGSDCAKEEEGKTCLVIRCEPQYGGCTIRSMIPPSTGESTRIFGEFRLDPRNFCEAARFVEGAIMLYDEVKED